MRVLITGGAGFIGSHLVDRFLADGFRVRVLDNLDPKVHPKGSSVTFPAAVEFIRGDVSDRDALLAALKDVDVVSHQAAYQDYMPDFSKFLHVNAVATALIYELIIENKLRIKKVIVASSQAVYGEGQYSCAEHRSFEATPRSREQLARGQWEVVCPKCGTDAKPLPLDEGHANPYNQYAVSKLSEEKIALGLGWLHGIPTVALRYSITQGPRQSLFNQYSGICRIFVGRALQRFPLIVYEDGRQTRDFVHIEDVIDANLCVLERDEANFRVFNVGSGRPTTVLGYADLVRKKLGCEIAINISGEYRIGDNRNSVSKIEKLQALGWSPKRDLEAILDDFLNWVESIGGIPGMTEDAYSKMRSAGVVLKASSSEVNCKGDSSLVSSASGGC